MCSDKNKTTPWEQWDFDRIDETAQCLYDEILRRKKPERSLEQIKNDLTLMTSGGISKLKGTRAGVYLLNRYVDSYNSYGYDGIHCLDELISWYAGISN